MTFEEYATSTLLPFTNSGADNWIVEDAMKGVSIMGGTGSGKTTASGRALAMKYLKEGWGGLVLCAKTGEAALWKSYCEQAGRIDDLIMFSRGSEYVFNPIDYELKRPGDGAGQTHNLVNVFMSIYRMGNRIAQEGDTKEERFWDVSLKRCLSRSIDLLKLAKEDLSYRNMVKLVTTAQNLDLNKLKDIGQKYASEGRSAEVAAIMAEDGNYCITCLLGAYFTTLGEPLYSESKNAQTLAWDYFTNSFQALGSRTRSIITESFMGLAEPFLTGVLYEHFAGVTNIFPEQTYKAQKLL